MREPAVPAPPRERCHYVVWGLVAGACVCLASLSARAEPLAGAAPTPATEDATQEARWRFDRGLSMYNAGDYEGALIEFERAQKLQAHPLVQLNVGLVQAKLGESVRAVETLAPLLETSADALPAESRERAQQTMDEHRQRIGTLEVVTVEGAMIGLDGVDVAHAPTAAFPVNAGEHVLSVHASGYEPRRLSVRVAGQATERVEVELLPLQEQYAQLSITTSVPDVQVREADEVIGVTPLSASVAFKPGVHDLTFERAGYATVTRNVGLHPGGQGELDVEMKVDTAQASSLGRLTLGVTEDQAVVWVDGEPRVDFDDGIALPVGRHALRVERAGFVDLRREVTLGSGTTHLEVELFPTADYLADYVAHARRRRIGAWVSIGVGGALLVGGSGFLIWNAGEKDDAEKRYLRWDEETSNLSSGMCVEGSECAVEGDILLGKLDDAQGRDLYGWLGVGLGAAGVITGVVLYVTGDDPDRYEADEGVLGKLRVDVTPGGLSLRGRF